MIKDEKLKRRLYMLLCDIAKLGDKTAAFFIAVFKAPNDVQEDMTDPEKFKEPVFNRYRINYKRYILEQNQHRLQKLVGGKVGRVTKSADSDMLQEIADKGLTDVILSENSPFRISDVSYFEATEHQLPLPMVCKYGDYRIKFASAGMGWCGSTQRENGFISKRNAKGHYEPVATISPELSDYLAKIVDEKAKMQKAEKEQAR